MRPLADWVVPAFRPADLRARVHGFSRGDYRASYQGTTLVVPNSSLVSLKGHGFCRAIPALFSFSRAGFSPRHIDVGGAA